MTGSPSQHSQTHADEGPAPEFVSVESGESSEFNSPLQPEVVSARSNYNGAPIKLSLECANAFSRPFCHGGTHPGEQFGGGDAADLLARQCHSQRRFGLMPFIPGKLDSVL